MHSPATRFPLHLQQWFGSDERFNTLYPPSVGALSRRHWTPLNIARKAAGFLGAEANTRILDIGSGVGKFCLSAAYYRPQAFYVGIEQRKALVEHAETARQILGTDNVTFIHGNFTQLDLRDYDHFYFYNSFYENLSGTEKIDNDIIYSNDLYHYYNRYLFKQLDGVSSGTRLVTFHSLEDEVPHSFHIVNTEMNGLLKYWIKE